jgi:mono/diheme cytochrome c family protein
LIDAPIWPTATADSLICINDRGWFLAESSVSAAEVLAMNALLALSAILVALATVKAPAIAQEIGEPREGRALANRLCAQCHAVQKGQPRSPNENAPTFPVIAAVPGMTAAALSATLNTSHRLMPNVILAPEEHAHIIAYILSLK